MADGFGSDGVSGVRAPGEAPASAAGGAAARARRTVFDGATVFGILGAFALMALAMALGGSPAAFIDLPSILIVIGGTLLITTASFTWKDMAWTGSELVSTVTYRRHDPREAALDMLRIADFARHHGVLKLQGTILESLRTEEFLHKALQLVVDGMSEADVEKILRGELAATQARHHKAARVLRRAAEISPAMGLIGTLIGLVQMLRHLDDPAAIGPGMAVALLTTFYGAILANMVFAPLASKLERNAAEESVVKQVFLLGAVSIGRKDNPRRLEMQLNSVLPPSQRVQFFD